MEGMNHVNVTNGSHLFENSQQTNITQPPDNSFEEDIQASFRLITEVYLKMTVCVIGICTNSMNIFTFIYCGFTDSITISFFALSIADFGFVVLTFCYQLLANLNQRLGRTHFLDLGDASNIVNFYALLCVDTSTLITVFIAVQKCACVAIPFLFKNIFTRFTAIVILLGITGVSTVLYLPLLTAAILRPTVDNHTNTTRLGLIVGPSFSMGFMILAYFYRMFVPIAAQVIVLVCTIVLTTKLKQASRRRRKMTNQPAQNSANPVKPEEKDDLSPKEMRVIQVVTFVSLIFVLCNTPDVISFTVGQVITEFRFLRRYHATYLLVRSIQNTLACLNSSINIIIYLKFNTKFREIFKTTILRLPVNYNRN